MLKNVMVKKVGSMQEQMGNVNPENEIRERTKDKWYI